MGSLNAPCADTPIEKPQLKVLHATIKKVGEDIETLVFNTAIAQMMVLRKRTHQCTGEIRLRVAHAARGPQSVRAAPDVGALGKPWREIRCERGDIATQEWPTHDEQLLLEEEVTIVVQVNGKVRDKIVVSAKAPNSEVEATALASAKIQELTAGKTIQKVVVVPKKLVNIVIR